MSYDSASRARPRERAGAASRTDEQFRLLVGSVRDYAIFMLDLNGRVVTWNAGAEAIKGYSAAEIIGRSFERFYPPEDLACGAPMKHLADAARDGVYRELGERVRKDGSRFWAEVVITALREEDGELTGFAKVTRDVTERRRAEEALARSEARLRALAGTLDARVRERTAQLADANLEMEAFNHTVSHDLRAPLRGIRGFAELLVEDCAERLGEEGREYCRRISAAGARMEQLIEDLLAYGRLNGQELSVRAVDAGQAVDEALALLAGTLREARAEVRVDRPLPVVRGHRTMLVQALQNLIANAVKFVSSGTLPCVRIRALRREACARICIEDNGIGIAPEHRERIFRVFERLHGEEGYPGTGMGLAIVRRAMERMGGRAGVEGRDQGGSVFWLELPAA